MSYEIRGVEFVCGQRGTGKTLYLRSHVLEEETRYFLYDHMAEYSNVNAHFVYSADEAIDYLVQNSRGFCRCIFVTTKGTPEEFRLVCRIPFIPECRDLIFVCDEIDNFAGAVRPWPPEEFKRLIHFGRHVGCSFVGAARRPADVSRAFTSQAKRYVLFRCTEPLDVRFLKSVLGERAEEVKNLPDLHYLVFEGGVWTEGKVTIPGQKHGGEEPTP